MSGNFRDDPLPSDVDAISLIRVLYDHRDDTVSALLHTVYETLPESGRLIVSEPMTGSARPERAGDAYFALYCMAMESGTARSADRIAKMLGDTGFQQVRILPSRRPYVTSVVTGVR